MKVRTFFDNKKRAVFEASIGNTKYQCFSLSDLKKSLKEHKYTDNMGAANDYGTGTYNGD